MKQKQLMLPPQSDGRRQAIDEEARQVVVVGANGAGKTRFTSYMIEESGEKAYSLSALAAIF